jgi:hypothetical protein
MIFWISRIARITGLLVFFILFLVSIDYTDMFNIAGMLSAAFKAAIAATAAWLFMFILTDALLRNIAENSDTNEKDLYEDGMMQRLYQYKHRNDYVKKISQQSQNPAGDKKDT